MSGKTRRCFQSAVLPYDSKVSETEIKNAAAEAVDDGKTDFRFIVNIDRAYVQ